MVAPYVAVVGAGVSSDDDHAAAVEVGRLLAERGAVVLSGGMTGVMEAACRGAKSAGGTTVGILPGFDRSDANEFVDIAITTGMGEMRNTLVVRAADVVVAVGGEFGTLSEVAFALKTGTPVVGLKTWSLHKSGAPVNAFYEAISPDDAVAEVARILNLPDS